MKWVTWFDVESSGVEAHSLADKSNPLIGVRIALILKVNKSRSIFASSANCMHQSESLLN